MHGHPGYGRTASTFLSIKFSQDEKSTDQVRVLHGVGRVGRIGQHGPTVSTECRGVAIVGRGKSIEVTSGDTSD